MTARTATYLKARLKSGNPDVLSTTTVLAQNGIDIIDSIAQVSSDPANYNFPAEYPFVIVGGTVSPTRVLTAGVSATVRFPTVPAGINGADTLHYLYINDGASSEAVLITGGTASASNQSNATLTFTPANNHSGSAWYITSASAGWKEADIALGLASTLTPSDGIYVFQAPVTLSSNTSVIGASMSGVLVEQNFTAGHCLTITGDLSLMPEVANFTILALVSPTSGSFLLRGLSTLINVHDVQAAGGWGHFLFDNCARALFNNCYGNSYTRFCQVGGDTGASGVESVDTFALTAIANATTLFFRRGLCQFSLFDWQNLAANGSVDSHILVAPNAGETASESNFSNGILDGGNAASIRYLPDPAAAVFSHAFQGVQVIDSAQTTPGHTAIALAAVCQDIAFNNVTVFGFGNDTNAVFAVLGSSIDLNGVKIMNCVGGGANTTKALIFGTGTSPRIRNCVFGYNRDATVDSNLDYIADFNSLALTGVEFGNNTLNPATQRFLNVPTTKTGWVLNGNTPQNAAEITFGTVASGASVALPLVSNGDVVTITGAVGINGFTGLVEGQFGYLLFTNAGPAVVTAGATIGNTFTAVQNKPVPFKVLGGKLYGTA